MSIYVWVTLKLLDNCTRRVTFMLYSSAHHGVNCLLVEVTVYNLVTTYNIVGARFVGLIVLLVARFGTNGVWGNGWQGVVLIYNCYIGRYLSRCRCFPGQSRWPVLPSSTG